MRRIIGIAALLVAATMAFAADPDMAFSDDFEREPAKTPPDGWTMWGPVQYKSAANYTLDATMPHSGAACFRIDHPEKTGGYIVSAPELAIRPAQGTSYTVTFWARARKPGKAIFGWSSYQEIAPKFVDAPGPGFFPFDAGPEWKPYSFTIREGLDFFADECRFLMLTFKATSRQEEEQTLWIDDVRVSMALDPNPPGLIRDALVQREPLQHRLEPGPGLDITLDPERLLRPANREAGGVSFHRVCGWTGQPYDRQGRYTLAPELETAIRDMRLPMTRFYGVGDEPFAVESSIDKTAEICNRTGISQEHCVLEFESQDANTKLSPEIWAKGVAHSIKSGYGFHHWEIANEPYTSMWGGGKAFPDPDAFARHFREVSQAIRKEDPDAQIGFGICHDNVRWGNYLLKQLAGGYDFIAPHYYCGARVRDVPFEETVLTENYRKLDLALKVNGLLHAYNPGRDVYQYDTEWGVSAETADNREPDYEDRNANIIGTLHRAVRMIYYAREGILRGASGWQMLSGINGQGFGILSQDEPDKRFLLYWLYYYFNRHVGESVLGLTGTAPYYEPVAANDKHLAGPLIPVLATISKDGKTVFLIIANASWTRTIPSRIHLPDTVNGRMTGVVLSNENPDGKPLLNDVGDAILDIALPVKNGEAAWDLPPHSVTFLSLSLP